MRKRFQKGCKKNKKERGISKERKVLQSRRGKNGGPEVGEDQRKKQNILRKINKRNTQNSFFERIIFHVFAFEQDSPNVFCLFD